VGASLGTGGWYTEGRPTLARDGIRSGGTNSNCPSQVDGGEGNTGDSLGGGVLYLLGTMEGTTPMYCRVC